MADKRDTGKPAHWIDTATSADFIAGWRAARKICESEKLPYPSSTGDAIADGIMAAFWCGIEQGEARAKKS